MSHQLCRPPALRQFRKLGSKHKTLSRGIITCATSRDRAKQLARNTLCCVDFCLSIGLSTERTHEPGGSRQDQINEPLISKCMGKTLNPVTNAWGKLYRNITVLSIELVRQNVAAGLDLTTVNGNFMGKDIDFWR
jgi:hypothetical protein